MYEPQSRPAVGDFNRNGFIRAQGASIVSQQRTWDFDLVAFARFELAIDPKGPVTSEDFQLFNRRFNSDFGNLLLLVQFVGKNECREIMSATPTIKRNGCFVPIFKLCGHWSLVRPNVFGCALDVYDRAV